VKYIAAACSISRAHSKGRELARGISRFREPASFGAAGHDDHSAFRAPQFSDRRPRRFAPSDASSKLLGKDEMINNSKQFVKARVISPFQIRNHGNAGLARDTASADCAGYSMMIDKKSA
jgi:hypothetical protein